MGVLVVLVVVVLVVLAVVSIGVDVFLLFLSVAIVLTRFSIATGLSASGNFPLVNNVKKIDGAAKQSGFRAVDLVAAALVRRCS